MGELIGCFPLETPPAAMSSAPSSIRSSRSSLISRESSWSSCSTTLTTLTIPDALKPPEHHKRSERVPLYGNGGWESALADRVSANIAIDSPSHVYPFALAFRKVPDNVLERILIHVHSLRSDAEYRSTRRDLYNLCLVSSRWRKAARQQLYHTLWIHATDLRPQPRRIFSNSKSPFKLLRRTLKDNALLCSYVREVRVIDYQARPETSKKEIKYCNDRLASIISPCMNLERLSGFEWTYTYNKDPLFQALSGKKNLRDLVWVLGPNERSWSDAKFFLHPSSFRPPLELDQIFSFIQFHSYLENLESLSIERTEDGAYLEEVLEVFDHLPALKHVRLANFAEDDFDAGDLQNIPTITQTLTLEALPGIRESGLVDYFANCLDLAERHFLQELNLVNVNLHSLESLATILDHMYSLKRLKIVTSKLSLTATTGSDGILHPFMSSKSLRQLHWEHSNTDPACSNEVYDENGLVTDTILAESILADGFPNLKSVCAPSDRYGIIQAVCRPISRPLVRAAAAGVELSHTNPVLKQNSSRDNGMNAPLIDLATNAAKHAQSPQDDGKLLETQTTAKSQAIAAYGRAADAIHSQRRTGRDPELGFRYNVLEATEPYITLYVQDENNETKVVLEFPQFLGRIGIHVPEYVLLDEDAG